MRPIGFEPPLQRFERSLCVGLLVGTAVAIATALAASAKSFPVGYSLSGVVAMAFALGFLAGFVLAVTRMEYAPPQPNDDGEAAAGVTARLIPPAPTLITMAARKIPNPPEAD